MNKITPINVFKKDGSINFKRLLRAREGETYAGQTLNGQPFRSQTKIVDGFPHWLLVDGTVIGIMDLLDLRQIEQVF